MRPADGPQSPLGWLHVAGAGARQAGRPAHGHLLVRLRAVRTAHRHRPFAGETVSDAIGAVLHTNADFGRLPRSTPPHVRRVLERCLQKEKTERYRDIGDVRLDLQSSGSAAVAELARLQEAASRPVARYQRSRSAVVRNSTSGAPRSQAAV